MSAHHDDPELRGPARLSTPRVSVVRLNRRVLYVIGGTLVVVVLAGLVALRAQGSRMAQDANSHTPRVQAAAGERWFDKVPDREPLALPAATPPAPAPPLPAVSAPPATPPVSKPLTDAELEAQRRERALRAAMSAPIAAAAFEARSGMARGTAVERPVSRMESAQTPAAIVPAAVLAATHTAAAGVPAAPRFTSPVDRPEVLSASVRPPTSRYEVKAGTIIPAVLLTGINSDLPGQLIAQVRENVFDTESGQYLLVPQGARLIGLYDHQVASGQERVLVTWKRVMFPNGSSLSLKDGMPGTDHAGAAGFSDQVNHHMVRVFGNALLLSIFSAGVQLSQIPSFGHGFTGPTAGNVLGAAVGQELGQTGSELIRRGMSIAPTIEIRPGYAFNVMVTQDLVFPGPYDDTVRP